LTHTVHRTKWPPNGEDLAISQPMMLPCPQMIFCYYAFKSFP